MRRKLNALSAIFFTCAMIGMLILLGMTRFSPDFTLDPIKSTIQKNQSPTKENKPTTNLNKPVIDLSGWQPPDQINYDLLSKQVIGAVIRVEATPGKGDGSAKASGEDKYYGAHLSAFKKRDVPVAVYAYVSGKTVAQMKKQAQQFYLHAKKYAPTYYWLDVEETNMPNMNVGIEAFRSELSKLGAKKIGIYAQDWFITENKINTSKFNAIWMADYGRNTGTWDASPKTNLNYLMQQYTSRGKISGYSGDVDLNFIRTPEAYRELFKGKG
ncbi:glycosyl hydrolase family 25 [Lactococcus hircilactis]|uniref:Glycosyl hydrolase family 25 n=1 Tax=Lactococcus hircilactis TaxID=1494462 RepID=A0A7X1Z9R2_9LACT|nr:GH25 family lysozyme [Lactococcus hircilactis]MQW39120.1 glycosyl hydrolase family 25 [Lactococcus hircilactis]